MEVFKLLGSTFVVVLGLSAVAGLFYIILYFIYNLYSYNSITKPSKTNEVVSTSFSAFDHGFTRFRNGSRNGFLTLFTESTDASYAYGEPAFCCLFKNNNFYYCVVSAMESDKYKSLLFNKENKFNEINFIFEDCFNILKLDKDFNPLEIVGNNVVLIGETELFCGSAHNSELALNMYHYLRNNFSIITKPIVRISKTGTINPSNKIIEKTDNEKILNYKELIKEKKELFTNYVNLKK